MKQKEYKFIAHIKHKDMTTEDNMFIDYTASARCRAKKIAERPDVEYVHLYRIDKTEVFRKIESEVNTMKSKTIETYTDKENNIWEIKIMTNIAGEKYKVIYKNGKKVENLGRIW